MTLAFKLYVLSIKAFIHRVYNDLLSEVVVALSSCVLALTFLYVFNDFLNVQVAGLSQPMRIDLQKFLVGFSLWLPALRLAGSRAANVSLTIVLSNSPSTWVLFLTSSKYLKSSGMGSS